MFHLNGSQTSWLVYADWLEDQGIPASHIREMAKEEITNNFIYEHDPVFWQLKVGSENPVFPIISTKVGAYELGPGNGENRNPGSSLILCSPVGCWY